ncbi:MAG: Neutral endopeptidase [Verrucomicrobiota bacterium]
MLRALRLPALSLLLLALRLCAPAESPSTPLPPPPPSFSLAFLDRSVDPGSDFYRFACGSWLKKTSIPEDETSWSPTAELMRRNALLLRALLENRLAQSAQSAPLPPRQKQLADFYAAALDQQRIDALGITPLQHDLEKIEALHSLEALASLLAEFHAKGIAACFDLSVAPDERQSDRYALSLSQGGLGLPERDYYFDARFAKERRAYPAHLQRVLTLAGRPATTLPEEIRAIVSLETALAKASRKLEDLSDPIANYHKISRAELAALTPSFPWETYWREAQPAPFESLLVGQPEFFQAWEKELQKRPLSAWKAYLRWKLLESHAPHLHKALDQAHFAFYGTLLQGQPASDPRWKRALSSLSHCLGESLGQLYVENAFPDPAREKALALVDTLRATYRDQLANASWMSAETRREALEKFSRFRTKIGSPTTPRDYSAIEIRADDYLGNLQRCAQAEWKRAMKRIGGPVDRDEWSMTAHAVNAYFLPTQNEIVFPAGILQPPFFDPSMDDAVNYGAIGATIGHEMSHGYDNEGRQYDAQGNLRDWWTPSDARAYQARAQKLVSQFNRFTPLPKLHVNGKLTLSENIADLNGLRIAFQALQRVLEAHPEKRQPIDGFSPEQRFFLAYAQSWAAKIRPAALRASLSTDSHAPDTLRGFAPLLHLQEFYDAFHIPPSAPLYLPPAKRTSFQ